MPSMPEGAGAPASSARVGRTSQKAQTASLTVPAFDLARPPDDHRHADAAVVHRPLVAAERPRAAEERGVGAPFLVRAVVAREEDDGIVLEPEVLQPPEHAADVAVEAGDHRGVVLLDLRPGLGRVRRVAGDLHPVPLGAAALVVGVRQGVGQEEEEGPRPVPVEEVEGLAGEEVGRVLDRLGGDRLSLLLVPLEAILLLVLPEIFGIIVVGVMLVQVAEPLVEPLAIGDAGRPRLAQAPLADDPGGVAGPLEDLGHRDVLGPQAGPGHCPGRGNGRYAGRSSGCTATGRRPCCRHSTG